MQPGSGSQAYWHSLAAELWLQYLIQVWATTCLRWQGQNTLLIWWQFVFLKLHEHCSSQALQTYCGSSGGTDQLVRSIVLRLKRTSSKNKCSDINCCPSAASLRKANPGDLSNSKSEAEEKAEEPCLHSLVCSILFLASHKKQGKSENKNQAVIPMLLCVGTEKYLQRARGSLCRPQADPHHEPTLTEEFRH